MMSSYSLSIQQFPQNPIPVLIYENARKFYYSYIELFGKSLIISFVFFSSPIWYLPLYISFTLTNRKVIKVNKSIEELEMSNDEYKSAYKLYQKLSEILIKFKEDSNIKNLQTKNFLLQPLFKQLIKFFSLIEETVMVLEDKLFQNAEDLGISQDDLKSLVNQMDRCPHDWDDDESWSEFQIEHNHLKK